jgi:4'-phosphopantetheinyl transferase EntD
MPLIESLHLSIDDIPLSIGLWFIDEPEAYFGDNLVLSTEESAIIQAKKSAIQRLQSLAARACLAHLVGINHYQGLTTCNEKPHLLGCPHYITLTHSFPYACAALCNLQVVAIDCESYQRERSIKAYTRFLNPREQEWLLAYPTLARYLFLWSAKEALYKLFNHPQTHLSFKYHLNLYLPYLWETIPEKGTIDASAWLNNRHHPVTLHFLHFPERQLIIFYCICNP